MPGNSACRGGDAQAKRPETAPPRTVARTVLVGRKPTQPTFQPQARRTTERSEVVRASGNEVFALRDKTGTRHCLVAVLGVIFCSDGCALGRPVWSAGGPIPGAKESPENELGNGVMMAAPKRAPCKRPDKVAVYWGKRLIRCGDSDEHAHN